MELAPSVVEAQVSSAGWWKPSQALRPLLEEARAPAASLFFFVDLALFCKEESMGIVSTLFPVEPEHLGERRSVPLPRPQPPPTLQR